MLEQLGAKGHPVGTQKQRHGSCAGSAVVAILTPMCDRIAAVCVFVLLLS
jgi:hypothetical protein